MPSRHAKFLLAIALAGTLAGAGGLTAVARPARALAAESASTVGRFEVRTVPFAPEIIFRTATYTPSGKVLVRYTRDRSEDPRQVNLATMDDDGRNMRPFFSAKLPVRPKDNGIRFMVFADNKRVFLGDFVLECATSLESCKNPALVPVDYPSEVADGAHVSHRWSEMIIAPDNRHVAWTTLFTDYSAMVFTGELRRQNGRYRIAAPRIVSTVRPFLQDPRHADGVLPQPVRGGEVKQFVHGGTAISMAGAVRRDTPDSVVQDLVSGRIEGITDTPGYNETTIFSPDERLGITMTTRFSPQSDLAILGLMPRPYPASLNMGLSMLAYTYSVTGVRRSRPGNVGPALIDIRASKARPGYLGLNLNTSPDWVFSSPMSWHPSGKKAMWPETLRGKDTRRLQVVELPGYRPGAPVRTRATPTNMPYASSDLSQVIPYANTGQAHDVKVYGRASGHIVYRRSASGRIEKTYVNFSDDGQNVYSGTERMEANPRGRSTYTADVRLTGPKPGIMALKMTFGPLGGDSPAALVFERDAAGQPLTRGYVEYQGRRLDAAELVP